MKYSPPSICLSIGRLAVFFAFILTLLLSAPAWAVQPTVPAAPTGLIATGASSSQINLSWRDNASNESGYYVDRSTSASGPFSRIATLGTSVTSYANTGLSSATTYYYRVSAYNRVGSSAYASTNATTLDITAPSVSLTSPGNGSTVNGTITQSATASDNIGVTKVEFYRDGILAGTVTASPYNLAFNTTTVANGPHSSYAKAYDAAGNIGTSATITATVNNPDITAPTVSVTAPVNGSTVNGTITLSATASDGIGVTKVEFYRDGSLVGTDTTSPYSITSDTTTVANGSHSFVAKAYDAAGNIGTSATITATVNNPDITAPTVSVTAPVNASTVNGTITLSATASDNIGVTKVEFYRDGTLAGTVTASPYNLAFNTTSVANGSHSFYAKVYDAAGNIGTSATITATVNNPDITAPSVSVTAPVNGSTVNGAITLSATASDNIGVTKVEFYRDGTLAGTVTASPYNLAFNTTSVANGSHSFYAKAYDAAGNVGTSATITATVNNPDTTAPTVSVTAPVNGSTVNGAITLSATASDNIGVTKVEFYRDGTLAGTVTASPYNLAFNTTNVANGSHSFVAKAYDVAGNIGTSATVTVTVSNTTPDTTVPTASLTAPANGSTVSGTITLSATASDNIGVTKVDFYRDGSLVGTDTTSPYSITSDTTTVANGSHSFVAKAYDVAGNIGTSATVTVTVSNTTSDATAPTASLTAPSNGSTVSGTITLSATATDNVGVSKVDFYRDGSLVGTDTTSPYSITSDTTAVANGSHSFVAKAYDVAGNIGTSATVTVTVSNTTADTTAPTASLTTPANGSTVSGTITLSANATDNVGVTKVDFYRDGSLVGSDTTSPYSITSDTTTVANGSHSFVAKAYDVAGNIGTSATVTVTVSNTTSDATAPTASLTAPSNGSTVSGTITLSATATDNVGVTKVDFYRDGSLVGTDTTSPYSITSDTTAVANGSHSFVAKAYDVAGNIGTSATVTVTVSNTTADTTAPTASLTAPANGSTVSGTITLSATSSDNVGVTKVDFYRDGSLVGTDTTSPYSITSDTTAVANGSHSFVAKAYDVAGNMGTSATVTVTVSNTTADTIAPTVTLTAPSSGSTVSGTITLTAAASDNVGVSKVEYWCDGTTLCATATTSPFSATDNTTDMANGSHTYKAKAFDAAGNSSTSAGTSVTVSNATSTPAQYVWEQQLTCTTSSSFSYVNGTAIDAAGNVVVAGYVKGSANIGGGLVTSAGQADIFVTKYSSNGTYSWSLRIGGASDDMAQGVAVDSVGNVYVIGYFTGTVDFGFGPITSSNPDIFLLKLSAQGAPLWCKQLGGTGVDTGYAVAVDSHDNVLITGFFGYYGTGIDFGFGVLNSAGGRDVFVAKYSPAGTPLWASRFGSTGDDWGTSIAVDRRDDGVLVTGNFKGSADFGGGALTSAGGQDMFLAKYWSTGAHLWSKRFGDTSSDSANSVAVDKDGNVALVGNFLGTVNFGAGALTYHSVSDMFIAEFNAAGGCLWSTNFGSDLGGDVIYGVATDKSDNVVVTGTILGNLDLGSGRLWGTSGSADILIAKFSNVGTHMWSRRYGAGFNDAGSSVAIDPTGNILTGGFFGRSVNFGGTDMTSGNSDTGFLVKLTP